MKFLTHEAVVTCLHGGLVEFNAAAEPWEIMGSPVLTVEAVEGAVINGCPQVGPGLVPCTQVLQVTRGRALGAEVGGRVPLLESLDFTTNGNPVGTARLIYCPDDVATYEGK